MKMPLCFFLSRLLIDQRKINVAKNYFYSSVIKVEMEKENRSFPISLKYTTNTNIAMRTTIDD